MSEWNRKRKVMRRYDHSASVYDVQYTDEQEAKIKAALNELKLRQSSSVLDLGCGTGLLFPHITKDVDLLVGLDFSSEILKLAKKRARKYSNIAIIRGDADLLPFKDKTFNMIFAMTLLQNIPNPLRSLREIQRVAQSKTAVIVTGLRKEFSQKEFVQLLKRARLEIVALKAEKQLKGYVAICVVKNS
ncbi:MAG: methyltransferase domain-containing protein [Candidatus Bathyarchaeota archaeon]|jgi:ubiquinone/menaquinone biosynthesis C-methylase UbiE